MLLSVFVLGASALCPFMGSGGGGKGHRHLGAHGPDNPRPHRQVPPGFRKLVEGLDVAAVQADLRKLFLDSKDFWPADYGNYAPFFVRLAWHNSGSYRITDGRGGPDGGRQRFDPERSWADNTNLDKARKLLEPIKIKYGPGLSWGDLIILAGNTAIESMGGPVLGFCAGRVDDPDGFWSDELGPTEEQEKREPCPVNGQCEKPFGTTTIGLIYLNPEGPMGQPLPAKSALEVRDSFGRMSMNDTETVSLIGGGHAFGKTHGACPLGAGPSPMEDPENPWPGLCGTGKGADAFTSGFEGPWTTRPTYWDNEYYKLLVEHDWEPWKGPGGHYQWRVVKNETQPFGPGPQGGRQATMLLTTDVSLTYDPEGIYQPIVELYAKDQSIFDRHFEHAWYKLTTRDMGPASRCIGKLTPPAQEFQYPLPDPPMKLASYCQVKAMIKTAISKQNPNINPPVKYKGMPNYGPLFVRLAWQCASTFRVTDWLGGCNGARLRHSPQKDWPINRDLDKVLLLLNGIKSNFGASLSWSDLIVTAGTVALEEAGAPKMSFCPGRTDANEDEDYPSEYLTPRINGDAADTVDLLEQTILLSGLSNREYIALMGGRHALGKLRTWHPTEKDMGSTFMGAWTTNPSVLDNEYFKNLVTESWVEYNVTKQTYYKAEGADLYMTKTDLLVKWEPKFWAIAMEFASDNDAFLEEFSEAWTKVMNQDRFDGPVGNVCDQKELENCASPKRKFW